MDRAQHQFTRLHGVLSVPRAHLHAAAARRALRLGYTVFCAFLNISLPDLVPIEHHLRAEGDGVARALASAFETLRAEVLQPEVDWLVDFHRQVRREYHGFRTRADEGIQQRVSDPR